MLNRFVKSGCSGKQEPKITLVMRYKRFCEGFVIGKKYFKISTEQLY